MIAIGAVPSISPENSASEQISSFLMFYSIETVPKKVPARFLELPERFTPSLSCYKLLLTRRSQFPLFRRAGGTVLFCVHGAQRAFGEQAECTQNKTEPAALAAATGNRKGAVAPLQCHGVWGRNAPNNTLNRTPVVRSRTFEHFSRIGGEDSRDRTRYGKIQDVG